MTGNRAEENAGDHRGIDHLDGVRAAQAGSGKWHLVGEHGCLNAGQATFTEFATRIMADKRNREWCRYCKERLRQLQLKAEVDRLAEELRSFQAIEDIPGHTTLPEVIGTAAESDSVLDFQRAVRCTRPEAKRLLHRLNLRQVVDNKTEPVQSVRGNVPGPNHDIEPRLDAPDHTGWGQVPQAGGDSE